MQFQWTSWRRKILDPEQICRAIQAREALTTRKVNIFVELAL